MLRHHVIICNSINFKVNAMRKFVSLLVLSLAAAPVFAVPTLTSTIPEPEVLALLGIGAVAFLASRRSKK